MKLSLINVLNEGMINFIFLQANVIKDMMSNPEVAHHIQGWFAASNWGTMSDNNIASVVGSEGMKIARDIVNKAATSQAASNVYDIPDVLTSYSRTPSAEYIADMKNSQVYKDVYNLYLSYFK